MKPSPRPQDQLIVWVAAIVQRECGRNTTGAVRVEMHDGVVQRVKVESVERPASQNEAG